MAIMIIFATIGMRISWNVAESSIKLVVAAYIGWKLSLALGVCVIMYIQCLHLITSTPCCF